MDKNTNAQPPRNYLSNDTKLNIINWSKALLLKRRKSI